MITAVELTVSSGRSVGVKGQSGPVTMKYKTITG